MRLTRSMPTAAAALALVIGLTGCDEMTESFNEGVNEGYVTEFVKACVTSATETGASLPVANAACSCTAERAVERLDKTELLSGSQEALMPIMQECSAELIDENGNLKAPAAPAE